jgi:hypothetical protein
MTKISSKDACRNLPSENLTFTNSNIFHEENESLGKIA